MRMNLKTWMILKIVPAALLLAYYHCMVIGYRLNSQIVISLSLLLLASMKLIKKNFVEATDEMSSEIIRHVDALCYRFSIFVMGIIILPFLFVEPVQANLIGYLLVGSITTLTVIRTVAFYVLDKRGI